jgi:predicted O-linked N-acetylglucosamine transferase (SPINDLY family)
MSKESKESYKDIMSSKESIRKNYKKVLDGVNDNISKSISTTDEKKVQILRMDTINILQQFVDTLEVTDYLLLDSTPEIPENIYYDSYFTLGTLYKTYVETEIQNDVNLRRQNEANRTQTLQEFSKQFEELFRKAINCFTMILRVRFEDELALKQITSVYTYLSLFSGNLDNCLMYMQEALLYVPNNPTIHYNLGYIYQKTNRLEISLIHYKISLGLLKNAKVDSDETRTENHNLTINNYNGISSIYRSLKQWPESLHYLLLAEKMDKDDPDVQNQLGVVYTEMRRTDLAERAYNHGIKNYTRSFVSTDKQFLLAELYLNLGHMHSYNGDNHKSVENYNKSLQTCPKFNLPFQNKIMNLNYLFDQLEDKMYITNQHKLVNKLYKKGNGVFQFRQDFFNTPKINIGIISGDFADHPVSFFISTFLKGFDSNRFNVTCFSECIINTGLYNKDLQFKTIRNMSAEQAANLIYNDKIHILFDLAGHTAFNRLDVFALKPSPIQITYIGYPFTTGLTEMDYRITDNVCDGDFSVSQKFYTEKLLALKNCFLCYDPTHIKNTGVETKIDHILVPRHRDGFLNIGCFNRVNKMTDSVVSLLNSILLKFDKTRLVLKTKALINKTITKEFVNKFDQRVRKRIVVLDCTISHDDHLLTYNQVDIAVDTFPYSGTTTTCEALYMGVPVFSMYDSEYYFHAQNVSCSILKNSGMDEYIVNNESELVNKIQAFFEKDDDYWNTLKSNTRSKFMNGSVCNKKQYMQNIEELLSDLYNDRLTEQK